MASQATVRAIEHVERRRSPRLPNNVTFVVSGESTEKRLFQERAFTISMSAHGALIALTTQVIADLKSLRKCVCSLLPVDSPLRQSPCHIRSGECPTLPYSALFWCKPFQVLAVCAVTTVGEAISTNFSTSLLKNSSLILTKSDIERRGAVQFSTPA